ncbi:GatB/YqeY domain-containing protein [Enterovibrio norvegicus]|uniref:GatB/YqeY domain-containing protein n=1 Tax=Enterovibrio norvegicus TaxID=188144 RepID=A0A2N7LDE4_9GAMM|nr:GatB/YqeY domain-containing protein [Enterovibrio norvegicus]MCC4799058.1 GatB/YqeY domain-containing protein [Enterovibrio norvegicus]OEF53810.1 glutamyl-tRNA amidotransferase [Enterovibrio norvegicus]PMH68366.1 glutamyl-tRNA amidotransferase [Enterovibrio norvegicus]PMI34470.1 glutamyl-tRNA amidotransferase [Enterovibrio norvegicus]PMI41786.1 glutamyl-tRNA amidotransferase [Enterovibrio norvegicus]
MELISRIKSEQIVAMKAKDKPRLGTIRLVISAVRQQEIDGQKTLNDEEVLAVLVKMVKQRRDSVSQYQSAGRDDLADVELAEISVLDEFMPQPLSDDEVDAMVKEAIAASGASSMQDMGKIMAILKPQVQGRADMGKISQLVKANLA